MAIEVTPPFKEFTDLSGAPLDNGYIYIGTENLNPEVNLISIYWDSAMTIPASNPLRTISGYPARNGSPARIYCGAQYSITVKDKSGVLIYSSLSGNLGSVVSYVDSVSNLATLDNTNTASGTVIVKDLDRGGTFIWSSTGTANGFNVFSGITGVWTRQEVTSIYSDTNYAVKTLHDEVVGATHTAGTAYTLSKAVSGYDAWTYGLIEFDISTTTSGMVKLQINGSDIFGDQPNGYYFSTDTILLDGTENNRILDNHTFTFAIGSISSAITSIGLESDTTWAGTVNAIRLYKLSINSMDLSIVSSSDIGQNYATGIKGGVRARGDMAFGDTSALMAFQYDGVSPTPAYNLAVGYGALASNQRGDENTAIGSMALMNNEGSNNVAVGYSALKLNTKGQENTSVGYKSGISNTTGYKNTYIGFWAGARNKTGIENVSIGWQPNTASNNNNKNYNTYIGSRAGSGYTGSNNAIIGAYAGDSTSGQENLAGSNITSIGSESKPRGSSSVAIGYKATIGAEVTFADYAIAIGRDSNALLTGNIALGYLSNASGTIRGIAIGQSATSSGNDGSIAIGETTIASGARSIAIGQSSGAVGQQSVSIGALTVASAGDYNTNIGSRAGLSFAGSSNTFVGRLAGNQTVTYSNCSLLGSLSAVTGSNQVQLGDSSTTTYVYGTVQNRSDKRDKTNIKESELGLDFINKLRPVSYQWDMREFYETHDDETGKKIKSKKDGSKKRSRPHYGLIAQEVKQVIDSLGIDFGGFQDHKISGGGDVMSLGYDEFIAPLIKAVQELSIRVSELEKM